MGVNIKKVAESHNVSMCGTDKYPGTKELTRTHFFCGKDALEIGGDSLMSVFLCSKGQLS